MGVTPVTRTGRRAGRRTKSCGAAPTRTWAALQLSPSRTIATLGTPTGRLAGRPTRRSGAVPTRRWAALKLFPSRTIAMLATPTRRLAGRPTRRSGAARTRRWGARPRSLWTERRSEKEKPCSATAHSRLYIEFDIRQNNSFLARTVEDDDGTHPAKAA